MSQARHWGLYSRLSGFYFVYFVTAGVFVPYWAVYLHSLGYDAAQIGIALGSVGAVRIVMPVAWGALMDRIGRRMRLIAVSMVVGAVFIAAVPYAPSFGVLVALHVGFAVFWNSGVPAFDVVTLNHVSQRGLDYPRTRLWGSIGFIVSVIVIGPMLDRVGLAPVPWIIVGSMLVMSSVGCFIPDGARAPGDTTAPQAGFGELVRRPVVIALFACCCLGQISFAPFFGFFSLFMSAHGYDNALTGSLWGIGVVAEVGVLVFAGRLIARFGARAVLITALATASLRWLAMALLADHLAWLMAVQLLQLASGGLYQAVTIHFIHSLFPSHMQGRAQALLTAVTLGAGGAIGNYVSGALWGVDGERVYAGAALVAAAACSIAWRYVREGQRAAPAPAQMHPA